MIHEVSYWLDARDRIVRTCANWDGFALDNDGIAAVGKNVRGESLWDFVMGDPTRIWLSTVLSLARLRDEPVKRPYRCDSPTEKRYMEMVVSREGKKGDLLLTHRILRAEPVRPPLSFVAARASGPWMARCSICNRVLADNRWTEPQEAFRRGLLPEDGSIPVIYGVCPDCRRAMPV